MDAILKIGGDAPLSNGIISYQTRVFELVVVSSFGVFWCLSELSLGGEVNATSINLAKQIGR